MNIKEDNDVMDEDMFVLKPRKIPYGQISIMVPAGKAEEIGLRPLLKTRQIDKIMKIMDFLNDEAVSVDLKSKAKKDVIAELVEESKKCGEIGGGVFRAGACRTRR